ncbi:MAG: hypothetical protein V7L21_18635 [Nostoc sp.]|uniref:hypothetical protein n=1 Tax=Nostoc sp. TaxID=1180 RepID=UPI002FF5D0B3
MSLNTTKCDHISQMLAHLQEHVQLLHKQRQRDLEIVNRNKIILADVVTEDIGTRLDHDRNNEVGKTIHAICDRHAYR